MDKILSHLSSEDNDLWKAAENSLDGMSSRGAKGLKEFLAMKTLMDQNLPELSLSEFLDSVIRESGLLDVYAEKDEVTAIQKSQNLDQIVNAAGNYASGRDGLTLFLEDMELDRSLTEQGGDNPAGVTLITMHNTKGLEFDRVIITGMDEGLFPGYREESDQALEEERRIFYVSLTRARKELFLTTCRRRLIWGRWQSFIPSLFIREIPVEYLEVEGEETSLEQDDEWTPGTAVYHDDYGSGVVCKQWHNGKELLVLVRFESGQTAQFIPRYTPLERIANDYY